MFSKKMFRLIFHESDFSLKLFICKVAVVQQKQKTLLRLREHDFLVFFYDSFAKFWPWSGRFQSAKNVASLRTLLNLHAQLQLSMNINQLFSSIKSSSVNHKHSKQELRRASDSVLCKCAFRYRATFSVCCFDGTIFRLWLFHFVSHCTEKKSAQRETLFWLIMQFKHDMCFPSPTMTRPALAELIVSDFIIKFLVHPVIT